MTQTILVTGGAGFIGSHTCKALSLDGFTPVVYDNLSNGHADSVKWGPLEVGDLADGARLRVVIETHQPAAVLHFAGFMEAGQSVHDPAAFYRNNVCGSLSLLKIMEETGLRRIVFSSTAAVYGEPLQTPIPEHHPLAPVNPYGHSKLMVEQILGDVAAAQGLRYCCLRYFNAAGADPDGELAERHDPETHLIPLAIQTALGRRSNIQIFGTDYDTPDGSCLRDYVHVSDLAGAHVSALRRLLEGGDSLTVNLGLGRGYSVREVISRASLVLNAPIETVLAPRRPGDPAALIADSTAARRALNWTPRYTELDDFIRHACQGLEMARD